MTKRKIWENPRTGQYIVMEQDPKKKGMFGEWKIVGLAKTRSKAKKMM